MGNIDRPPFDEQRFQRNIDRYVNSDISNILPITWELLGLNSQSRPSSYFDIIRIIDDGIPKYTIECFSHYLDIPMTSIAPILNMSYKTLTRKKSTEKLDSQVSSLIYEIASTYAKAFEIFRDRDKINHWFNKPNKALNGQKPFDLLKTVTGIKLVNQVLGRIEEGVYS